MGRGREESYRLSKEVKNEAEPLMIKRDKSVKEKGRLAAEAELDWSGVWRLSESENEN